MQSLVGKLASLDERPKQILSPSDLAIRLVGRDKTIECLKQQFNRLIEGQLSGTVDRTQRLIPLCASIPGMGKTRLLYERDLYLPVCGSDNKYEEVIVTYGNGHSLQTVEEKMSVESSLSWRILFYVFLEKYSCSKFSKFTKPTILPKNISDLTLDLVIEVIRKEKQYKPNQTLYLFLGIDEYQKIRNIPNAHTKESLTALLECIIDNMVDRNTILLPFLTGTSFSSSTGSSGVFCNYVSPKLLTYKETLAVVQSIPGGEELVEHAAARRALLILSGPPRPFIQFALSMLPNSKILTKEDVDLTLKRIQNTFAVSWDNEKCSLTSRDRLLIVAYSLSGQVVDTAQSPIPDKKYTWKQLADACVCIINEKGVVLVTYESLVKCSWERVQKDDPVEFRCLVNTLQSFCRQIDEQMDNNVPWQLWETFGAHYYALRINSLLYCGITTVPFSAICKGSLVNGCDIMVKLHPVTVLVSSVPYGEDMPAIIGSRYDPQSAHNWLNGDNGIGQVWKNQYGGKGVDIFFSLEAVNSPTYVICVDQRKRIAASLGVQANNLFERSNIIPKCAPLSVLIRGLCNVLPEFNSTAEELPNNCFLVCLQNTEEFHTSLACHPAAYPAIDINNDLKTYLKLVLNHNNDCATAVFKRVQQKKFNDHKELRDFICNQFPKMDHDRIQWDQMEFY
eukprot:TRINITY_DN1324_c0_g1_i4.p1 TRINITY_DN1324_c0_g1~~TRINITY_DN1324_c0_g1_i4.p1  ORF type:complete len:678 (-),score=80.47 TRINITY_DN1324_c0_g1_i4:14-2047(-)